MKRLNTKNFFCVLGLAVWLFPFSVIFAAAPGDENRHFHFPHFFSPSPDDDQKFVLRFNKGLMQFGNGEVLFQVVKTEPSKNTEQDIDRMLGARKSESEFVRLNFLNANSCSPEGSEPLASHSNYFLGGDASHWRKDLANFNALVYPNLYANIDLKYYVVNDDVKYDYTVNPGGTPASIRMKYSGVRSLLVDNNGTLCIQTELTELKDNIPKSYQVIDGKEVPVKVRYKLIDPSTVTFEADEYDKRYPLVIDPLMIYSTFVGGTADDYEYTGGISLDASGNIYVTGRTLSSNFPVTAGAVQTGYGATMDAFVFKLNPTGTAMIFSTFVGGNDLDAGYTTKIDPVTNDIYVAGTTGSANFPTTAGAFHTAYSGGIYDPFLFKLTASGNAFIYSTLMGNAQDDYGAGLEIDDLGNAYVVGQSSGIYPTTAGAYQTAYAGGTWDVFVTKFNTTGSAVIFSTMLGGPSEDHSHSIQVDAAYNVYIGGMAKTGFPTTAGCYDATFNGGQWDMYVTKMNSNGTALIYSTYVGSPGADWTWNGLEIDNSGNAYCVGYVESGFPTTAGAYQTSYGGGSFDVGIFKLNPTGSALIYSTYIGGPGDDEGWGISLGSNNEAFVTGLCSFAYPYTHCAWDTTFNGAQDAFISELDPTGSSLLYSSYIGGALADQGYNIIDVGNFVYVAGSTSSIDFPHTVGAYDTTYNGARDIVVFEMDISGANVAVADFNSTSSVCINGTIQFNNTSLNATSYNWNFDDGTTSTLQNPSHTFADTGVHYIQLIVTGSCALPDTVIYPVTIIPAPIAAFNASTPCGLTAAFSDASTGATGWSWDFGDGATSVLQSPSHTYSIDGNYMVTLIVTNAAGCSDTVQQQVTVNPLAVSSFSAIAASCQLGVTFQNTSSNATSWSWNFGDGNVSSLSDPSHTFPDSGSYTVTLIANPGACADTSTQTITVHSPPVASFSNVAGCNLTCSFSNTNQNVTTYAWDFGDGNSSAAANPVHTYTTDGNYAVSLIVTDNNGCADTVTQQVQINPVPLAGFNLTPLACSNHVDFLNTSTGTTSYSWSFGDGSASSGTNPSHDYPVDGNYTITLIADPAGCPDTSTQSVTIHPLPQAAFSGAASCNYTCNFQDGSSGAVAYAWDFGDATNSNATSPSHSFPLAGNYFVTLIITDQYGCNDTVQQNINISEDPLSAFSFTATPCNLSVPFQNNSSNGSSWIWNFGDGQTSTDNTPEHVYPYSGTYPVTLISDPGGCADTATQNVTVHRPPVADFSQSTSCTFTAQFVNLSDSATSYQWDFGDGSTATSISATHAYDEIGTYYVSLISTDNAGCADTMQQEINIIVRTPATMDFSYDTCLMQAQFVSTSVNTGSWYWSFGDGTTSTSSAPAHVYNQSGYVPVLFVTNNNTPCADTLVQVFDAAPVPEHAFYIPNCFTPNGDGLNDHFEISDFGTCFSYHLMIFDRWGELIFETDDLSDTWDGTYKGSAVQVDVYAYILKGGGHFRQGSVLVLKD